MNLKTVMLVVLALAVAGIGTLPITTPPATEAQQVEFQQPVLIVNTSALNIRSGPGGQFTIVTTVPGGTTLPVLGISRDRGWYLVATAVGNGWVTLEFVLPRGEFSFVPFVDPAPVQPQIVQQPTPQTLVIPQGQGGGQVFVPGTPVTSAGRERVRVALAVPFANLRSEPFDEAGVIGLVTRDDTTDFRVVGQAIGGSNTTWFQFVVPGVGTGWMDSGKLRVSLSALYATVVTVTADSIGMTNAPGGSSDAMPIVTRGQELFLIGFADGGATARVETIDGIVGFLPVATIQTRTGTPSDELAEIVRSGGTVPEQGDGSTAAGQGGGGTVPVPVPAISAPIGIVNTPALNVRSGPGNQFTVLTTVAGGTQAGIVGLSGDLEWFLMDFGSGQGWVDREFVLVRGNLDNVIVYSD